MENKVIQPVPGGIDKLLKSENIYNSFHAMLGARTPQFLSSIITCVSANPRLRDAKPMSVVGSAAIAASLDLPINSSLGLAHIVPYNTKDQGLIAQFQMGYKGYIQLGQRTSQYRTMHSSVVHEGELVEEDPIRGYYVFDTKKKKSDKVIGYNFYFSLLNGFEKYFYWPTEKCVAHGKRYSQTFKKNPPYGMWVDNFDAMALKTVTKLSLAKYGPLSIDMKVAIRSDQAAVLELGAPMIFPDNPEGDGNTEMTSGEPEAEPQPKAKTDAAAPAAPEPAKK